ncbi:MAG: MFS transporter [Candidatus Moduliflexus flocculans]|nr:MFS transporter [Candidatus Moduliflexus flocculans]
MVYPFLPVFARLLGVDLGDDVAGPLGQVRDGRLGTLLAPFTDRRGRRFGLSLGLGLFAAGAFLGLAGPGFIAFAAALVLMTVGKYVIDPAVLAHLSDVVPYARRGRALALTELSWSLAFILGVPAAGFLLGRFGCPGAVRWSWPFWAWPALSRSGSS